MKNWFFPSKFDAAVGGNKVDWEWIDTKGKMMTLI